MDRLCSFVSSNIPCPQNGQDSLAGGFLILTLLLTLFLWLERKYRKLVKGEPRVASPNLPYKQVIIWENVCSFGCAQLWALYALYLVLTRQCKWQSSIEALALHLCAFYSTPGGCHRLYSHRAFKASKLYEVLIIILNSALLQNPIIHWARDHRCHHKYIDTNADPYPGSRGLFFSHVGWLLVERHPDVVAKGRKLDISDLTSNPLLKFQQDHYLWMVLLFNFLLPVLVPQVVWGETFWRSIFVCWTLPWVVSLHCNWSANSIAHWRGPRPYNSNITPVDIPRCSLTGMLVTWAGEHDHNFHHAFPQDYYSSEYTSIFSWSGNIIKLCSLVGLTRHLKVASPALIARVKKNNSLHQGEDQY